MTPEQSEWLSDFVVKLYDAAQRAEDPTAKAVLYGKWGNASFILGKFAAMDAMTKEASEA